MRGIQSPTTSHGGGAARVGRMDFARCFGPGVDAVDVVASESSTSCQLFMGCSWDLTINWLADYGFELSMIWGYDLYIDMYYILDK